MVSNMMVFVEGNKIMKVLRDTASPKPGPGDIPDNMADYMCSFAYDFIAMFNKMLPVCKIVIPDFIDGNGNNRVTKYQPQSQQTQRLTEKSRSSTPNNNFHPRNEDKKEGIKCHWCGRTNHPAQKCNLQGHPDANKDASTKWRESAGGLKLRDILIKRGDSSNVVICRRRIPTGYCLISWIMVMHTIPTVIRSRQIRIWPHHLRQVATTTIRTKSSIQARAKVSTFVVLHRREKNI